MTYNRKKADDNYYAKIREKTTTLTIKLEKEIAEKFKNKLKKDNLTYKDFTLKNIEKYLNNN